MKTFRELYIHLSDTSPGTFFKLIEENLSRNWIYKEMEFDDTSLSCYQYLKNQDLLEAYLFITEKETNLLHVSNIIPVESGQLSYDEYNAILLDFFEHIVKPVIEKVNVKIELTDPEITLNEILSSECSRLFAAFSKFANKSTGSSNPADQEKWFSFIKCIDENSEKVNPDTVQKLLIDDGWPENKAIELALEFEFALSLLNFHHKDEECHA